MRDGVRCTEGGGVHSDLNTGLDVVDEVLCSTRRCVWCGRAQASKYGLKRPSWKTVRAAEVSDGA